MTRQLAATTPTTRGGNKVSLQLAACVPKLDGFVTGARDDQSIVGGEGHGQHVIGVTNEGGLGHSRVQDKQAHRLVPRGSQDELAITGQSDVLDEMIVSSQGALGNGVRFTAPHQLPHDCRFIYEKRIRFVPGFGSMDGHHNPFGNASIHSNPSCRTSGTSDNKVLRRIRWCRDACDPVGVTLEGSAEGDLDVG